VTDVLDPETASAPADPSTEGLPFSGLKVADFTWSAAGPIISKQLADLGATVVRVESSRHPDSVRFGGPFLDDIPGINRSGFFADFNSSKLSLALNMANPASRDVALRLIDWADLVMECFTPRVMEKWGLDYPVLSERKPDLVMFSSCLQGATGPYREYAGYGGQGASLAGIHYLTGWPDREPCGPKGAYTDTITPRFGLAAIAAALAYRREHGVGQHIDVSQIEAALQFLAPEMVDYTVSGRVAERTGNRNGVSAPCGVFRCAGDDRWIAIEVRDDRDWAELVELTQLPQLADPGLTAAGARLERQDDIEAALQTWLVEQDAATVVERAQQRGIPASLVEKASDLFDDPQLLARRHFVALEHPEMGVCRYNGPSYQLSRTPAQLRSAAPLLGQHTEQVMTMLGYSAEDVTALIEADILV
jgi:benzylsuccinate CoA-transferase BbsF subunit